MTKEEVGSCLLGHIAVILGKLSATNGMTHIVAPSRLTAALLHGLDEVFSVTVQCLKSGWEKCRPTFDFQMSATKANVEATYRVRVSEHGNPTSWRS